MQKIENSGTDEQEEEEIPNTLRKEELKTNRIKRRAKRSISRVSLRSINHHKILNSLSKQQIKTMKEFPTNLDGDGDYLRVPLTDDVSSYQFHKFSIRPRLASSKDQVESISELENDGEDELVLKASINENINKNLGVDRLNKQSTMNNLQTIKNKTPNINFLDELKKKRLNESPGRSLNITPKILLNSRTMNEQNSPRLDLEKSKNFKEMYDTLEKDSERKMLNSNCKVNSGEINPHDASERVIVGVVRKGIESHELKTLKANSQYLNPKKTISSTDSKRKKEKFDV